MFPVAAEGHGLMEFTWRHDMLPALTNRERPGAGVNQPRPKIAEQDLQSLLGLEDDYLAAAAVAEAICQAWEDVTPVRSTKATYGNGRWVWNGIERLLADGWSMGVGWSLAKKHKVVDLWVSRQGSRNTFWYRAGSADEFDRLLDALSDWWWTT